MTIAKWEPLKDLITLQDRMNRLFDESMRGILKAELPEVSQKDIDIQVENNTLVLRGERKLEKEARRENFHRIERAYGAFARSFTLPATIDQEKIRADYKDGILKVVMPKREETKPKQIRVSVT
jgi:HSP20 family protein